MPRSSIITAACALLVRGWRAEGSEVVLDFPVSRRVHPESKTIPGMVSGIVPLVLTVSPESTVADFCEHVDTRIREALQHQRFPVQALERKVNSRDAGQPADRVNVNFIPSVFTLDFGGVAASASYTSSGLVGGFGLFFSGLGDELFLSTAGAGGTVLEFRRLRSGATVAAGVGGDDRRPGSGGCRRSICSMTAEHARLDEVGQPGGVDPGRAAAVSIPVLFAAQVARAPEAVAMTFDGSLDDLPRAR